MNTFNSILFKTLLVLVVSLSSFSIPIQAATLIDKQPKTMIRFIGRDGDTLVFDVFFKNEQTGRFRIIDGYENILFDEKMTPKTPAKRFKIAADGISKLHFESILKDSVQRNTFSVTYKVEEKVLVTEVK